MAPVLTKLLYLYQVPQFDIDLSESSIDSVRTHVLQFRVDIMQI